MQYPQTRYQDTLAVGITNAQLSCAANVTPPTRTQGILTIGRLQSNTEDVYFTNVVGNNITIGLRGLSQTALTPTTVGGNQLVHNQGESLEITTHHNYDTDLLRKDENDTVTGEITFTVNPIVSGINDANGNTNIATPATTSAVNHLSSQNSATGNPVILQAVGTDTNVNLKLTGQGTGVVILEDGSQLVDSTAPTAPAQIANKAYVDAQISSISTKPSALYAPSDQIVADTVSSSDITNNQNLLYFYNGTGGDNKWHKVTGTQSTWYYPLGLCTTPVTGGSSGAQILLQGEYTVGTSFSNIAPSFTYTPTTSGVLVGQSSGNSIAAFLIDNSQGAECIVTGGTISALQEGTPAGPMWIGLVLQSADQNSPACFFDTTNNIPRGAILASTTIAQALFSGTYTNLPFTWGNIKIPANAQVYVVVGLQGTQSNTNNYALQIGVANTTVIATSAQATWSGSATTGYLSLTVTSTSPVGYSVKAYGTGNNGSYALLSNTNNTWNRPIGYVTSLTTMIFNPINQPPTFGQGYQHLTATSGNALDTLTFNFCPTSIQIRLAGSNVAAATKNGLMEGYIRGDNIVNKFNPTTNLTSLLLPVSGSIPSGLYANGFQSNSPSQNLVHIARLENGCYVYIGYPAGAGFLSASAGTWTALNYGYAVIAT